MGNRVTLYNVDQPIPATYLFLDSPNDAPQAWRKRLAQDFEVEELGETNNTGLTLPWLLYFAPEDFVETQLKTEEEDDDGEPVDAFIDWPSPVTTVARARERIQKALPVFEQLAGDATLGREYWQAAVAALDKAEFDYLTLDYAEVILAVSDDPSQDAQRFAQLHAAGLAPLDKLVEYLAYTPGVKPYSHAEWDQLVTDFNWEDQRQMNAIALGYGL